MFQSVSKWILASFAFTSPKHKEQLLATYCSGISAAVILFPVTQSLVALTIQLNWNTAALQPNNLDINKGLSEYLQTCLKL